MTRFVKLAKSLGGVGTVAIFGILYCQKNKKNNIVNAAWTTNFEPSMKWDYDWDKRETSSLPEPMKLYGTQGPPGSKGEQEVKQTPTATRNIILIRHGQTEGVEGGYRVLTPLGIKQAEYTGQRLQEMGHNYNKLVCSTMPRAMETSGVIHKYIPSVLWEKDSNLCEGSPIPPEPPVGRWKPEHLFHQDNPRVEASFRRYFYRASPEQTSDSFDVIVCHSIVIRYFVCRALQVPPEAWLRFGLNHASITWLSIRPTGRVLLMQYGDSGHMPVDTVTAIDLVPRAKG